MVSYPSDWKTYSFNDMFKIYPNNTLSRDKLTERGSIGNIHYGDVLIKYGDVLSERDKVPMIKSEYEYVAKTFLQKNDVIIADTAEDATVGKVTQIGEISFPVVGGLHTIVCRPLISTANGYLGYYMNSKEYHNQLLPYITGIKVSSISKSSIQKTEFHVPATIDEQAAIVSVITAFDTHIANLAELIEKKKAIRDGALEDLVSGRTRLTGFTEEWIDMTIADVTQDVISGGTPSTSHPEYWGGTIPWLASTEIHQKMINRETTHITEIGFANSSAKIVPAESVLVALAGQGKTRGTAAFLLRPMALNQSLAALVNNEKILPKFLFYLMESMYLLLREMSSGDGGRGGLNKTLLKRVSICIPIDVDEQKAITDVLTAMDDEIKALEDERNKIIQIREGAMDDLLTGRVRLEVS